MMQTFKKKLNCHFTKFLNSLQPPEQWRIVFYISAGIYLIGCVVYWIWASGEVQPWAMTEPESSADQQHEMRKNGTKYTVNGGHTNEGAEIRD